MGSMHLSEGEEKALFHLEFQSGSKFRYQSVEKGTKSHGGWETNDHGSAGCFY